MSSSPLAPKKSKQPTAAQRKAAQTEALLAALRAARQDSNYPPTATELADSAALSASEAIKLLNAKPLKSELVVADPKDLTSPIFFAADLPRVAASDLLLEFVARRVRAKRLQTNKTLATEASKIVTDAALEKRLKEAFAIALKARLATSPAPEVLADLLYIKPTPEQLATKVLEALREEQHVAEPTFVPQARLLERLRSIASEKEVKAALKQPLFLKAVVLCNGKRADKKNPAYFLQERLHGSIAPLLTQALAWRLERTPGTTLFSAKELAEVFFTSKTATDFALSIEQYCDRRAPVDAGLAWLRSGGKRQFFRRSDIEPAGAAPTPTAPVVATKHMPVAGDFAAQFVAAFDRLDAQQGQRNFLKVHQLRQELAHFDRGQFDAGLRALRIANRFTMESASGSTVLTAEERAAGIQEGPLLLVYVSRS